MNGSKAKAFRRAAGLVKNAPVRYRADERTIKQVGVPKLNPNGSVALGMDGKPLFIGSFQTQTLVLDRCARQVYQLLKGMYRSQTRLA
jgi:uncharacterized protein YfaQ (DUF2300 family)